MHHIVGHTRDHDACPTDGEGTNTWTDSDGIVDWSPTIILWGLPLHCEGHTVLTILLNSGGGGPGRRGETCSGGRILTWGRKNSIVLSKCRLYILKGFSVPF